MTYYSERDSKGEFLGAGVSGIVELLPEGHALKSAWPGYEEEQCRQEIALEANAYRRLREHLGDHMRFLKLIAFDAVEATITLEYLANGTLREYLRAYKDRISRTQRHKWVLAAAEGLELLHSTSMIHCDFSPRNMLLDLDLELKIADFGCCSMDGSLSPAGGCARFYPPRDLQRTPLTTEHDLFALGSSIYEIITGMAPYEDVSTPLVQNLYAHLQFPDLSEVELRDIIRDCWLRQITSATEVRMRLQSIAVA